MRRTLSVAVVLLVGLAAALVPVTAASADAVWADATYGTFTPFTLSGVDSQVVALPAPIQSAAVTASYTGSGSFFVSTLDGKGDTLEYINSSMEKSYVGTSAFGINKEGYGAVTSFDVTATGTWTMVIAPISTLPALSTTGNSDGAFLWDGPKAKVAFTHVGESNFIIQQGSGGNASSYYLSNEIGSTFVAATLHAGPSVVTVRADGAWTLNIPGVAAPAGYSLAKPKPVSGVKAVAKKTSVKVSWKKSKGVKPTRYVVEVRQGGETVWSTGVKGSKKTAVVRYLESGTKYTVRVRAYTAGAASAWKTVKIETR